ncbi:hypothetical protein, partial [Catenuloplanes japonicus]|uniref:hypothetical protein n=1 Tax=Catenuloplanes japonicus TaxID=33876 RepID=UPI001E2A48D1
HNPKTAKPGRGINHNWHWLFKHPVEFSKNNHTPHRDSVYPNPGVGYCSSALLCFVRSGVSPGASITLPGRFRLVKSAFRLELPDLSESNARIFPCERAPLPGVCFA